MDEFSNGEGNGAPINNTQPVYEAQPINSGASRYKQSPTEEKIGFSVTSMVCGIASLVFLCINGYMVLILAVLGIVFGVLGKKKGGKGLAITGITCGIVALAIYLLIVLMAILGFAYIASNFATM